MPKRKFTKETLTIALTNSKSIREVLGKLGVAQEGGNYKVIHRAAKTFGIDISHLTGKKLYKDKIIRASLLESEIIHATKNNISYSSVLKSFKLNPETNANNNWLRKKISKLELDINHFLGRGHLKGKTHNWNVTTPLSDLLIEDSLCYTTSKIKKRLIKEGILTEVCSECGITHWQNKKLSLHLDHISGCNSDYRIENLRLLCPNCHSLTPTYCRRKKIN